MKAEKADRTVPEGDLTARVGRTGKRMGAVFSALIGCAVILACVSSAQAATASPGSATSVPIRWTASLRMDYTMSGYALPIAVAIQKGFYAQRGLNLSVQEGAGSGVTTQQVGTGAATFGVADVSTAALYIAKGVPVKAVAVFLQQTPNGLAYLPGLSLSSARDLQGKTIGMVPGEAPYWLLEAAVKKNKIPTDSFKIDFLSAPAIVGSLLSGSDQAIGAFSVGVFESVKAVRPDAKFVSFAQWGVNALSTGLIASDNTIEHNPAEVEAFVAGAIEGEKWALSHQAQAVALTAAAFPNANPTVLANGLRDSAALLHTRETKGMPIGITTLLQWDETINLDANYGGLTNPQPVKNYYTNVFVCASLTKSVRNKTRPCLTKR